MYEYNCFVTKVVDGDTVHADVDLGCDAHIKLTLRLARINAPELPTPEGQAARDYLLTMVTRANGFLKLKTLKDHREKYGRYLAELFDAYGRNLNDEMVKAGHAEVY